MERRGRLPPRQQCGLPDLPRGVPRRVARSCARGRRRTRGTSSSREWRSTSGASSASRTTTVIVRCRLERIGTLERHDTRGDPHDGGRTGGRGGGSAGCPGPGHRKVDDRSVRTSGRHSSKRSDERSRAPLHAAHAGAGRAGQQDRLHSASDDSRPRPPAERRLRRLSRGASARRRRSDRARSDRGPSVGPPHLAHARGLPAGAGRRAIAVSRRRFGQPAPASSCSCFTEAGSRSLHLHVRPRSLPPPFRARASASSRAQPRAEEIDEIVAGYARAAELAAEGGLDGVEISAAHRYLIEQFFDPALNRRDDAWRDGSRFLHDVLRAVRRAAPGLCVGVRVSADSKHGATIARVAAEEGVGLPVARAR